MIFMLILDITIIVIKITLMVLIYELFDSFILCEYRKRRYKIDKATKILITGGSRGIGRQIALNFAKFHKVHIIIFDLV
jgi:hypothetical protein